MFADVQKYPQISIFSLRDDRGCSLVFTWVGVKLVSTAVGLEVLAERGLGPVFSPAFGGNADRNETTVKESWRRCQVS